MILVIPICPEPQRRGKIVKRGGFSGIAKTDKQVLAEHNLIALLSLNRPKVPLVGPLVMGLKMVFPIPASLSQKKRLALMGQPHWKKPDSSNCLKHIEDCMQRVAFFGNDAQIAKHTLEKIYDDGHGPRWEVTLEEICLT